MTCFLDEFELLTLGAEFRLCSAFPIACRLMGSPDIVQGEGRHISSAGPGPNGPRSSGKEEVGIRHLSLTTLSSM